MGCKENNPCEKETPLWGVDNVCYACDTLKAVELKEYNPDICLNRKVQEEDCCGPLYISRHPDDNVFSAYLCNCGPAKENLLRPFFLFSIAFFLTCFIGRALFLIFQRIYKKMKKKTKKK